MWGRINSTPCSPMCLAEMGVEDLICSTKVTLFELSFTLQRLDRG